jgi:hypothetical protein
VGTIVFSCTHVYDQRADDISSSDGVITEPGVALFGEQEFGNSDNLDTHITRNRQTISHATYVSLSPTRHSY